jgi:hypothetical protein
MIYCNSFKRRAKQFCPFNTLNIITSDKELSGFKLIPIGVGKFWDLSKFKSML